MKVHHTTLPEIERYLENNKQASLQEKEQAFRHYLRLFQKFRPLDSTSRVLEIGTGTGWFVLLCEQNGIPCKGLEISPQLIQFAKKLGEQTGINPDIELGNIEDIDLGVSHYDVIYASSVFEHVEYWRPSLKKAYDALKPGGVFYFASTNKFSFTSGEWNFPLYGWLPNRLRYRLRIYSQGEDIMKLGIDFNQFTYPELRRAFREIGFSQVFDRVQISDAHSKSGWKRSVIGLAKRSSVVRHLLLTFCNGTIFLCVK